MGHDPYHDPYIEGLKPSLFMGTWGPKVPFEENRDSFGAKSVSFN